MIIWSTDPSIDRDRSMYGWIDWLLTVIVINLLMTVIDCDLIACDLIDRDWLVVIDRFNAWLFDRLYECLTHCLIDFLIDWSIDLLIDWLISI